MRASTDGEPSRKSRGIGSLANRARQPDSAREGDDTGGDGEYRGRFMTLGAPRIYLGERAFGTAFPRG